MLAIGVAGLQTLSAQPAGKPWTVSATVRGFYDDNVSTLPDDWDLPDGQEKDTFGFQVNPRIGLNLDLDQTTIGLGYDYSYKYYDEKPPFSEDHDDQSHTFTALLNHVFSDRFSINVRDSFVIGQEPDRLRAGDAFNTFQRLEGDNIRNYGEITALAQINPRFGLEVGYDNSFFDYDSETATVDEFGNVVVPSFSGLLDRIEHAGHIDLRYGLQPTTVGLVGYQYREINYTADEVVAGSLDFGGVIMSDDRNSRSHYGYAGVEHSFRPDVVGKLRAGASWTDYYNDANTDSDVSPFVRASLAWTYAENSTIEGGVSYDIQATDVIGALGNSFTYSQDAFTVFANLSHQITPKLRASLLGQFQNSSFNGGLADDADEQYYIAGVNLEYMINQWLSTHVGYNYDYLDSEVGRTFDRNRVYIGLTARY